MAEGILRRRTQRHDRPLWNGSTDFHWEYMRAGEVVIRLETSNFPDLMA